MLLGQTGPLGASVAGGVMKRSFCFGSLVVVCLVSCGSPGPTADLVATTSSPIQGGTTDTTHLFAVGVVQLAQAQQNMVAFCSGVLLAPNLVATARHCVAELSSTTIDCSTSTFGPLYPASMVYVTTDTTITMNSPFASVSSLVVPTGSDQTAVCGNDIALLILADSIELPQYVEPVISPPMTSPQYEPEVTAIGYGIDTPTDTTGMTAGTRRIKEDVELTCIPNDTTFSDCFSDPTARQVLTASEFVSGDSTCEGDSGSGAFEQSNFDQGRWVAFGVLSRGGVSSDGKTCEQPIYSRFDAWGSLIIGAAQQAAMQATAQKASYSLPSWAGGVAQTDGGAVGAGSAVFAVDSGACPSGDCLADDAGAKTEASSSGGCAIASAGVPSRIPAPALALLGLGLAAGAGRRRRASPRS
jgi:secreted trypsin-like serine protease